MILPSLMTPSAQPAESVLSHCANSLSTLLVIDSFAAAPLETSSGVCVPAKEPKAMMSATGNTILVMVTLHCFLQSYLLKVVTTDSNGNLAWTGTRRIV